MNKYLILFLMAVLSVNSAVAASALFTATPANKQSLKDSSGSTIQQLRQQGVALTLDRKQLQRLKPNARLQLPAGGKHYDAVIKRLIKHANGSKTWIATLVNDKGANKEQSKEQRPVILTVSDKSFFIRLVTPTGVFVMSGQGNQGTMVTERVLRQSIDTDESDVLDPRLTESFKKKIALGAKSALSITAPFITAPSITNSSIPDLPLPSPPRLDHSFIKQAAAQTNNASTVQIDVLVLYTAGVVALYNSDHQTRINHLFAVTNQIYIDSGVLIQVNPVVTELTEYSDTIRSEPALQSMTNQTDPAFINIHNRRFEVGADTVMLMRPSISGDLCGAAWGNGDSGLLGDYRNYMYSTVSINCDDTVTAHELGHNMGLAHSRTQLETGIVSHGRWDTVFKTNLAP
ncbi:MAG: hypothetical protein HRT35_31520 [Algicola sp.]|nr:hypothetical protein [Algicola sp.]